MSDSVSSCRFKANVFLIIGRSPKVSYIRNQKATAWESQQYWAALLKLEEVLPNQKWTSRWMGCSY